MADVDSGTGNSGSEALDGEPICEAVAWRSWLDMGVMGREAADCETCESGENGLWPAVAVEAALPVRVIAGAVTADAGVPALDGGEKRNFGPGRVECVSFLLGSAGGRAGRERC